MSLRRNALLLVLAAALLAILGQWGEPRSAGAWRIPAALLLLGLAYEAWQAARARPTLSLLTAQRWLLGRPTSVRLQLQVARGRSAQLQLALTAPLEFTLERAVRTVVVPAGAAGALELSATARRLGRFVWPALPAQLGGALGLAWWSCTLRPECTVQVVPEVLAEAERVHGTGPQGAQSMLRLGSGAEVLQLREYRAGDAPRDIDWKASARLRRLMSRDYAEQQHLEIVLGIDVGRASALAAGASDRLTLYANIAARFAQRALWLDDAVGLLLYAERPLLALPPARGSAALLRLRAALSSVRVQEAQGNALLAGASIRSLLRQRGLVILLTDLDDGGAIAELSAAARLLIPKHLPFIAGVRSTEAAALAHALVEDEAGAWRALAAQEYLAAVERNVRALQSLGAAAVLAPAAVLEQAILQNYVQFRQRRRVA
jgi:uncharacterized protein (DUF58 family)